MKKYTALSLLFFIINTIQAQSLEKTNDSLFNKAKELILQKEEELALQISLKQIDNLPDNSPKKAKWFSLTGDIFRNNNELDKALIYYRSAFSINKKLKDSLSLMKDHIKLGIFFNRKFNDLDSIDRLQKKGLLAKDSAIFYYNKNIQEFSSVKNSNLYKTQSHNNLSYLYSKLNELDKAQFHISKAIIGYQKENDNIKLNKALNNQGLIYIYQKQYKKAEKICLELLSKNVDSTNLNMLRSRLTALGNLDYIYTQTNNFQKAYELSERYYELDDVIRNQEKAAEITAIEAKYNQDKARQEEAEKTQREIERRERMQLWFGISGLVAVSVFLFGLVLYRNSKLKQKSLTLSLVKQELEQQRALKLLQQQNQNKVINATLDGREKERKDIAQTLHDSVSALLSSANLHLQVIKKKSPGGITEIEKSQRIINEASDKVRDLSHKLISAVLLKFGLEHAVYDMCEKYSNDDLTFELESEDKIPRFNQAFEIKLHNIIEEFINNIIKHSKASDAIITLNLSDNNILNVDIKDNGIGFDTSKIEQKSNGIGLSQIIARIESLDGTLDIKSAPNQGTEIHIIIPVLY